MAISTPIPLNEQLYMLEMAAEFDANEITELTEERDLLRVLVEQLQTSLAIEIVHGLDMCISPETRERCAS